MSYVKELMRSLIRGKVLRTCREKFVAQGKFDKAQKESTCATKLSELCTTD